MSRVSVLIPNFNAAGWLEKTILSCIRQQDLLEIIVVDDKSTDGSWELLSSLREKYPNILKIYKSPSKGGNTARNYAYSLSRGEYIQWLDADDQLKQGKFKNQLAVFENDDLADIVYSDWELITYKNNIAVHYESKKSSFHDDFIYKLLMDDWSSPNCYLLKRRVAQKLNDIQAWNPSTRVAQDREYFTMAAIIGARFAYMPGIFAVYNRWNNDSVSSVASIKKFESVSVILKRFETEIEKQNWITPVKKLEYQHIINTEKLLMRVLGYPVKISRGSIEWGHIKWGKVKGIRTNLKLIWEIFGVKYLSR